VTALRKPSQPARRRAKRLGASTGPSVPDRVYATLRACLVHRGDATPTSLAAVLGMSVRTLQRRLGAEGCSLRGIRDEVCRERALERLKDPGATVSSVASELGFSDVAAFSKAFKRWTGESPSLVRRRNKEKPA
jgi:AraC-like DNA-binding protein